MLGPQGSLFAFSSLPQKPLRLGIVTFLSERVGQV